MKKEIYLHEFNILMEDRVYLPSSSGMLRAYAESDPDIKERYEFKPFIFIRDIPEKLFANYQNPAIAAFSSSMWNHQLNLTMARMIKEKYPECLIIFGGPQLPKVPADFFGQHNFVDIIVHGEGEHSFADILKANIMNGDFKNIPGISYRQPQTGQIVMTGLRPLIKDIDQLPSPFLAGVYDDLIAQGGMQYQVIFETMRGCPFTCSYCYWGHNNKGPIREFSLARLEKEIEWMARNKIKFVFGADSNFGMWPRDLTISRMFVVAKQKYGYPETFRVCFGKNAEDNNFQVAKLLNDSKLTKGVTLSRQSNNPEVLKNIKRQNISMEIYERLQKRYHAAGIGVYTEFILGLPGETYQSFVDGIEQTIEAGLHDQINIFFCEALPNTDIADPEYIKKFGIVTRPVELAEFHASKRKPGEVVEYDNIVIATDSMPVEDWKLTAAFSWLVQVMFGLKMGFFISAYLYEKHHIKYSAFCEYVLSRARELDQYPVLGSELNFYNKSLDDLINNGTPQCAFIERFGDISWALDEASYLHISERLIEFYKEVHSIALSLLEKNNIEFNKEELDDVFVYQQAMIPGFNSIVEREFAFKYNIPEYFDNFLKDIKVEISQNPQKMTIDDSRDFKGDKKEFAKQVVWFSRKDKGIINSVKWQSL